MNNYIDQLIEKHVTVNEILFEETKSNKKSFKKLVELIK